MSVVLPFLRTKGETMKIEDRNEAPKTRSIILPSFLWEILDRDAKRCKRSATKQVEAILSRYYNVEASVELDDHAIVEAFHVISQKRMKA